MPYYVTSPHQQLGDIIKLIDERGEIVRALEWSEHDQRYLVVTSPPERTSGNVVHYPNTETRSA